MLNLNYGKSGIAGAIALLMGITAISPFHNLKPANAQLLPRPSQNYSPVNTSVTIPAGTRIPMDFQNGERILVSPEETLPITLRTAATIRDSNRNVLIPAGSEVNGEIRPVRGGSQFIAREIIINGQPYYRSKISINVYFYCFNNLIISGRCVSRISLSINKVSVAPQILVFLILALTTIFSAIFKFACSSTYV